MAAVPYFAQLVEFFAARTFFSGHALRSLYGGLLPRARCWCGGNRLAGGSRVKRGGPAGGRIIVRVSERSLSLCWGLCKSPSTKKVLRKVLLHGCRFWLHRCRF